MTNWIFFGNWRKMMAKTDNENRMLNAMRLIAALFVVSGHLRTTLFLDYSLESHNIFKSILFFSTSLGNSAVLVFFTLSGYWVGGSAFRQIRNGNFDFRKYIFRRLIRLWIVLLPALVLTVFLDYFGAFKFSAADVYARNYLYTGMPKDISHSLVTFIGNIFFLQKFIVSPYGYNNPLWSLSYEFWYYVAFPCTVLLFAAKKSWAVRLLALAGLGLTLLIGGEQFILKSPAWVLGALAGAWPALLDRLRERAGESVWAWCQAASAIAIVGVMSVERSMLENSLVSSTAIGLVTSLALLIMARDSMSPNFVLTKLSRLSHCTYTLYATHMPFVVLCAAILRPNFYDRWHLQSKSGIFLLVFMLVLYVIAWLIAKLTENRTDSVRAWLSRFLFGSSAKAPSNSASA